MKKYRVYSRQISAECTSDYPLLLILRDIVTSSTFESSHSPLVNS